MRYLTLTVFSWGIVFFSPAHVSAKVSQVVNRGLPGKTLKSVKERVLGAKPVKLFNEVRALRKELNAKQAEISTDVSKSFRIEMIKAGLDIGTTTKILSDVFALGGGFLLGASGTASLVALPAAGMTMGASFGLGHASQSVNARTIGLAATQGFTVGPTLTKSYLPVLQQMKKNLEIKEINNIKYGLDFLTGKNLTGQKRLDESRIKAWKRSTEEVIKEINDVQRMIDSLENPKKKENITEGKTETLGPEWS